MTDPSCALCGQSVVDKAILDHEEMFCCYGCRSVYSILKVKGELDNVGSHPLFKTAVQEGIISNPSLLEEIKKNYAQESEESQKIYIEVEDLWCLACCELIALLLKKKKGIIECHIDYATDLGVIVYDPRCFSKEEVLEAIRHYGYHAKELCDPNRQNKHKGIFWRFSVAAFCALNIMMCLWPVYGGYFYADNSQATPLLVWGSFIFALPVVSFCGWPIFKKAYLFLKEGILGMELLVTIGVAAAFSLSLYRMFLNSPHVFFDSMSVIITFVLLGKFIESKAKFSAKSALFFLHKSLPKKGRVLLEEREVFVALKDIKIGDVLIVKQGEQIPLDGVIVSGEGLVDESVMTGESVPKRKILHDSVVGGALLKHGGIYVSATTTYRSSSLAKIIDWIEKQLEQKPSQVDAMEHIIRWFVPAILCLAFMVMVFDIALRDYTSAQTLQHLLSILLISCPCAIGIAVPLSESMTMHRLAQEGILVRNRKALPLIHKVDVLCIDKTGTLTQGVFKVLSGLDSLCSEEKAVLKSLARFSIHPVARAVDLALVEDGVSLLGVQEVHGRGMVGHYGADIYHFGSKQWLLQEGVFFDEALFNISWGTCVGVAKNLKLVSVLILGDELREDVSAFLKASQDLGQRLVLLSGDGRPIVESLAREKNFDEWYAEVTPLEKKDVIEQFKKKGHTVMMVGDGVNDALALTTADIGVAIVGASDFSLQVCDFLMTTPCLMTLHHLFLVGRLGKRIVCQNLFWAFFYNIIGIFLALLGTLMPIFAAFAMVISSLMVIGNSLRIKKIKLIV